MSQFARFLSVFVVVLGVLASPGLAQQADPLEAVKTELDQIELTLDRRQDADGLTELRRALDPLRDRLVTLAGEAEPRLADARERLTQLGPRPAEGQPPEADEVRAQREAQQKIVADADARVRQIKVLQVRSDQLSDRITDRRRQAFTAQLFERTTSVFDPRFFTEVTAALPRASGSFLLLIADWRDHLVNLGVGALLAAAAIGALVAGLALALYRMLRRRGLYAAPADEPSSPLHRVVAALRVALERAFVLPLAVALALAVMATFDLILPRAQPLIPAIMAFVLIIAGTRGVMQGALAPGAPAYRLVPVDDETADALYDAMRAVAWIVALGVLGLALARVIYAPVALTMAITAATAFGVVVVSFVYLRRTTSPEPEDGEAPAAPIEARAFGWTRPALWLVIAGVLAALTGGFVALGSFAASRVAAAVVIACATVLVIALIDAVIGEWLGAGTARGRSVAAGVGIRPERLDLIGTLIGGLLRVAVLVASAFAVFGPWGFGGVGATLDDAMFGLRFAEVRTLALTIVGAGVIVAIGFVALRAVQTWLAERVLPRTGMDSGLQNSVATIFGYAGVALVIGLGLRHLGLDLSNLAIVAGALSVGIGFGLQSIVSNFVSGLILLAERPIRVGDSIVVRGEEGYVRKISVRSTEIETFERATVIVPNADLISGVVKNWTHSNTLGRIVIPVRVAYDSDTDMVREALVAAACAQRHIVQNPPPRVYLMRFADLGLDFELRCVVSNVDYSLTVKSDLQLDILHRFRQQGVIIAPPAQYVQTPPPGGEEKSA